MSHVSVGTNVYTEDWGQIVTELHRKSQRIVAGDFEGFDASQHQLLLQAAGEVMVEINKRFLGATEEDVKVMRVLLISLINSLHITGTEVYQWTHSLPSGHYLTAPINSVFVNIVFGCVWQICFEEYSYMFARLFWKECAIVAYGDDHLVSIPQSRIDKFNQLTLPSLFEVIGLSYTSEDKESKLDRPSRFINEVTYLRRSFLRDEQTGKWLAPLSLDVVLETPMWLHKTPDKVFQTIENLEWAIRELSLHPKAVWEQWYPRLQDEQRRLGYYTSFVDQDETRNVVLSGL